MLEWTSGYVADINYTYGYYAELNPLRLEMVLPFAGLAPPPISTACELGFGQGVSVNIHAAASGVAWHGTDFNPAQAAFANDLAAAAGSGARLSDEAFSEFASRSDLPDFDFIGVHGIWSWISPANRQVIVDLVRRKLKAGGVLYVSYNTVPGWATMVPMRKLMARHAEVMSVPGTGMAARIDAALAFADRLMSLNPAYLRANPAVADRMRKIMSQSRDYLAHEYFNRDWDPVAVADMAEVLYEAKLTFAAPAHPLEAIEAVNVTPEGRALLGEIADPVFRETVRDLMVNQQFRRDYWVKGARRLNAVEQAEAMRKLRFVLQVARADVTLAVKGALGEAKMQEQVYLPLVDLLADNKPHAFTALETAMKERGVNLGQLGEAMMVLVGKGEVAIAQPDSAIGAAKGKAARLNRHLVAAARANDHVHVLASPVTGAGVPVDRLQQMFLLAASQGAKSSEEWSRFAWSALSAHGQAMMKDGQPLVGDEANLAEIVSRANDFAAKRLPVLKALMAV